MDLEIGKLVILEEEIDQIKVMNEVDDTIGIEEDLQALAQDRAGDLDPIIITVINPNHIQIAIGVK